MNTFQKIVHVIYISLTDPNAKADAQKLIADLVALFTQASAADKPASA